MFKQTFSAPVESTSTGLVSTPTAFIHTDGTRSISGGDATSVYSKYLSRKRDESKDVNDLDDTDDMSMSRSARLGDLDTDTIEQSSIDKPIAQSNMGYQMLLKMGWKGGEGLGLHKDGRTEPVRSNPVLGAMGLGRWDMEITTAGQATESRKQLMSEIEETEELKDKRKLEVEKKEEIDKEIKKVNEVFYCADCVKQYVTVMQFENHMSSYDHHHTKRLKELARREKTRKGGVGLSRKKEDKKMQREMAKMSAFASAAQKSTQSQSTPSESRNQSYHNLEAPANQKTAQNRTHPQPGGSFQRIQSEPRSISNTHPNHTSHSTNHTYTRNDTRTPHTGIQAIPEPSSALQPPPPPPPNRIQPPPPPPPMAPVDQSQLTSLGSELVPTPSQQIPTAPAANRPALSFGFGKKKPTKAGIKFAFGQTK